MGTVSGNFTYIVSDATQSLYTYTPNRHFTGGVTFNFLINRKLSFQPELLLTRKSANGFRETAVKASVFYGQKNQNGYVPIRPFATANGTGVDAPGELVLT